MKQHTYTRDTQKRGERTKEETLSIFFIIFVNPRAELTDDRPIDQRLMDLFTN